MTIPQIIQQQLLHKNKTIVWSWGVSKWVALSENTLALRVHGYHLNGIVCITLDQGQDLYDIEFFSNKSFAGVLKNPITKYEAIEGVYCDQLVEFIDNRVEKIPDYKY